MERTYEYILIVSILLLTAFAIWEAKFAQDLIPPFDIWSIPSYSVMILMAFFTFMGVGTGITVRNQEI